LPFQQTNQFISDGHRLPDFRNPLEERLFQEFEDLCQLGTFMQFGLTPGTSLGVNAVTAQIGQGGMGPGPRYEA
jgi:hypothetical protein